MRDEKFSVVSRLNATIDSVVSAARDTSLGVPALASVLLARSKGDPHSLVVEALRFRGEARTLRAWVSQLAAAVIASAPSEMYEIRREIAGVTDLLHRELGLKPPIRFVDAIEISPVLPFLSGSVSKLVDWIQYRKMRGRYAILSEVSKAAVVDSTSKTLFGKLVAGSSGTT